MVEALIASTVMIIIMLAIARLVEHKKNYKRNVEKIETSVRHINEGIRFFNRKSNL